MNERSAGITSIQEYLLAQDAISGWLYAEDILLFQEINAYQQQAGFTGDLLEIGVYHGKTAILMGYFPGDDERLVVCDLFQTPAPTQENQDENKFWYSDLTRALFETNYLRFHAELPTIVACPSSSVIKRGRLKRSFRFVHIDGCHLYSVVRRDMQTAKKLLMQDGIVIIDDYRSVHTPGVAAATWQEVTSGRLIPLCLTPQKMYATWDQSNVGAGNHLIAWARQRGDLTAETETVSGRKVLRLKVAA